MTTITTPEHINFDRLLTVKQALRLETLGMSRRGQSAYSAVKKEFALKGTKVSVLEKFTKLIEEMK